MGSEDRVVFKAVPGDGTCSGCAFEGIGCNYTVPPCMATDREDHKDVIWVVEKEADGNARTD